MTHFEALNAYFAAAVPGEAALHAIARDMGLDPDLGDGVRRLRSAGLGRRGRLGRLRLVHRAGCSARRASMLTVHANPGEVVDGRLVMELPVDSPVFSPSTGIDKPGVVRLALATHDVVAFAGDGPPDLEPSLLVRPELRFATGHLAGELERLGEGYHRFECWSEVARTLAGGGAPHDAADPDRHPDGRADQAGRPRPAGDLPRTAGAPAGRPRDQRGHGARVWSGGPSGAWRGTGPRRSSGSRPRTRASRRSPRCSPARGRPPGGDRPRRRQGARRGEVPRLPGEAPLLRGPDVALERRVLLAAVEPDPGRPPPVARGGPAVRRRRRHRGRPRRPGAALVVGRRRPRVQGHGHLRLEARLPRAGRAGRRLRRAAVRRDRPPVPVPTPSAARTASAGWHWP